MLYHQYQEPKSEKISTLRDLGVSFKSMLKIRSPKSSKVKKQEEALSKNKRYTIQDNILYSYKNTDSIYKTPSRANASDADLNNNSKKYNSSESVTQSSTSTKFNNDNNNHKFTDDIYNNKKSKAQRTSMLLKKISSTLLRSKSSILSDNKAEISQDQKKLYNHEPEFSPRGLPGVAGVARDQLNDYTSSESDNEFSNLANSKRILPNRKRSLHYASMLKPHESIEVIPKRKSESQLSASYTLGSFSHLQNDISWDSKLSLPSNIFGSPTQNQLKLRVEEPASLKLDYQQKLRNVSSDSTIDMDDNVIDIVGSARRIELDSPGVAVLKTFDIKDNIKEPSLADYNIEKINHSLHYSDIIKFKSKQSSDETLISSKNSIETQSCDSSNANHTENNSNYKIKDFLCSNVDKSFLLDDIKINGNFSFDVDHRYDDSNFGFLNPLFKLNETPSIETNSINHYTNVAQLSFSSFDSNSPNHSNDDEIYNDIIEMNNIISQMEEHKPNTDISKKLDSNLFKGKEFGFKQCTEVYNTTEQK
ncbi:hypothetical protein BB561_004177 [Smittium simulii]|uniref:Uncharacterized protein n=1 Tax=Smittium simulii TaxID=133385 RepID=A0A2T9YHP3_9FUNG|nr:hypothetical protein BB561_004177 [Smittium simulii]